MTAIGSRSTGFGMKRKLQLLVYETETKPADISESLSALGIQEDGVIGRVLAFLDDLDDEGFGELSDFQNTNWVHFTKTNRKETRPQLLQGLHVEFCSILETKIESFLVDIGCTMERFYSMVRLELCKIREQEQALIDAFSIASETAGKERRSKRRCISAGSSKQQRAVRVDSMLSGDEKGALGLIKFINEASDFNSFVTSMEEHAVDMLRWRKQLPLCHIEKTMSGDLEFSAFACSWCSRAPCFDPWHRTSKSEALMSVIHTRMTKLMDDKSSSTSVPKAEFAFL